MVDDHRCQSLRDQCQVGWLHILTFGKVDEPELVV